MTFDEKEAEFTLRNHIHIGEELTVSVNHIGTVHFSSMGNSMEEPITRCKVQSNIKILRLSSSELEELGKFFLDVAKKIE